MIVIVEGLSAAGKTTWCQKHYPEHTLEEVPPGRDEPNRERKPRMAAEFWQTKNAARWARAEAIEAEKGLVICDTDPCKLHYSWCLFRLGELTKEDWFYEVDVARGYFERSELGIGDLMLIGEADQSGLAKRKEADSSRRRRYFDLHRQFGPLLREWYGAVSQLDPRRVVWELPPHGLTDEQLLLGQQSSRTGADVFDRLISYLPRLGRTWAASREK